LETGGERTSPVTTYRSLTSGCSLRGDVCAYDRTKSENPSLHRF
jgi:hypothetical protein